MNALLTYLATGALMNAWWMRYAVAALDVSLVSVVIAFLLAHSGSAKVYLKRNRLRGWHFRGTC